MLLPLPHDLAAKATAFMLLALAAACAGLWLIGGGTYFVKELSESHNIILAASNVEDFLSLIVQDVAASPNPAAHPYWYIHHPNLFAKIISLLQLKLGLGLEAQIGVMLILNVGALTFAAAAFHRNSPIGIFGAILVAATSYGSFHFSAGDLVRGPLYLLLWPTLLAAVANRDLTLVGWNTTVAATSVLAVLSDWGFAVFLVAFAFFAGALGRERLPWRWFLTWIAAPSLLAWSLYMGAVIAAVGLDFALFDIKVTYLGRLGVGGFADYRSVLNRFQENNVVVWPAHGTGIDTLPELITGLVIFPLLNTGPAWVLLMPLAVTAVAKTFACMTLPRWRWVVIVVLAGINSLALLPAPILLPVFLIIAAGLRRVPTGTPMDNLCALLTSVVMALLVAGAIFPSFTMTFTIAGGRPPLPLLEMSAAALAFQVLASGRFADRVGIAPGFAGTPLIATAVGSVLAVALIEVILARGEFFGVPRNLAIGLAAIMAGGAAIAAAEIHALRYPGVARQNSIAGFWVMRWFRIIYRLRLPIYLFAAAGVLALHRSASPVILERFSQTYAIVLSFIVLLALALTALVLAPAARMAIWRRVEPLLSICGRLAGGNNDAVPRLPATMLALFIVGQVSWLVLSAVAHPPRPIPYADLLKKPEYRGKGLISTSYEGIAWYSTRGWVYMSPANPPDPRALSSRFRHFADWKNGAKYRQPDYFLCDNTGFSYVRPGTSIDKQSAPKLSCRVCTCRDAAAWLAQQGHIVEVDREDFAIVRFRW